MVQYWRQVGITYIKYLNLNAMMTRRCLKEPLKTKALERDGVHFNIAEWKNGKAAKPSNF
jgi:F-type H+-transporting ATPase subunit epsilon